MVPALLALLVAAAPSPARVTEGARQVSADARFLEAARRWDVEGPGRGHDAAALFVSSRMEAIGLAPAGDGGGWLQAVPLRGWSPDPANAGLALHGPGLDAPIVLRPDEDFVALPDGEHSEAEIDGPIAFAGYAISAPEYGYDDLRGVDLRGKVGVVLLGSPASDRPNFFPPSTRSAHADPAEKMRRLAARGAVGAILVALPEEDGTSTWESWLRRSRAGSVGWGVAGRSPTGVDAMPARAVLSPVGFERMLRAAGVPGGLRAVADRARANRLSAQDWPIRARLRQRAEIRDLAASNVLGLLRGRDPVLGSETVLVTAPLDGVGRDATAPAALLRVAASLASLPGGTRRSVLFAALAGAPGERHGASYLASHLPPGAGTVIAQVGADPALAARAFTAVAAAGADASGLSETLRVAAGVVGVEVAPDPRPGSTDRADGPVFAREGVPFVTLAPSASGAPVPDAGWSAEALERQARLEAELVNEIAQADARPGWTAPNPWDRRGGVRTGDRSASPPPGR